MAASGPRRPRQISSSGSTASSHSNSGLANRNIDRLRRQNRLCRNRRGGGFNKVPGAAQHALHLLAIKGPAGKFGQIAESQELRQRLLMDLQRRTHLGHALAAGTRPWCAGWPSHRSASSIYVRTTSDTAAEKVRASPASMSARVASSCCKVRCSKRQRRVAGPDAAPAPPAKRQQQHRRRGNHGRQPPVLRNQIGSADVVDVRERRIHEWRASRRRKKLVSAPR